MLRYVYNIRLLVKYIQFCVSAQKCIFGVTKKHHITKNEGSNDSCWDNAKICISQESLIVIIKPCFKNAS